MAKTPRKPVRKPRKHGGRRDNSGRKAIGPRVSVALPTDLMSAIETEAAASGVTIGAVIRRLLAARKEVATPRAKRKKA